MKVAVGADHAGFPLKDRMIDAIRAAGHEIRKGEAERGVLICGSGVGASVAANKFKGIRAALCHDTFSAHQGVEDDQMNILCLGARVAGPSLAEELVTAFLRARFSGADRHARRVAKVIGFEQRMGSE
jgi:ribose 5-phosphate isomerase B